MHGYREDLCSLILKCAQLFQTWVFIAHWLLARAQDGLEVYDQTTGKTARYETFVPRSEAPYSKLACDKLQTGWISSESDEEIADSGSLSGSEDPDCNLLSSSYIDDDDRFADTVWQVKLFSMFVWYWWPLDASHLSSGVCDILITGKVGYAVAPHIFVHLF